LRLYLYSVSGYVHFSNFLIYNILIIALLSLFVLLAIPSWGVCLVFQMFLCWGFYTLWESLGGGYPWSGNTESYIFLFIDVIYIKRFQSKGLSSRLVRVDQDNFSYPLFRPFLLEGSVWFNRGFFYREDGFSRDSFLQGIISNFVCSTISWEYIREFTFFIHNYAVVDGI